MAIPDKIQKFTFAATSNTITAAKAIKFDPGSEGPLGTWESGDHVLVLWAKSTATGLAGTIQVVLADADDDGNASNEGALHVEEATIAPLTRRSNWDQGGGDYVCSVTFASGGDNTKRLTGARGGAGDANNSSAKQPRWYILCTSLGALSQIEIFAYTTKAL